LGYLHSGFEKLGEHLNYNQYVTIVDRMDYSAPIYNELAWHGAVEKLMNIDLTAAFARCLRGRSLMNWAGFSRTCCAWGGGGARPRGVPPHFLYGFNQRENHLRHHRIHQRPALPCKLDESGGGSIRICRMEEVFKRMVKKFINEDMPPAMEDVEKLLNKNRIFIERTKRRLAVLTREEAVAWSITGPPRPAPQACAATPNSARMSRTSAIRTTGTIRGSPAVEFQGAGHDPPAIVYARISGAI